MKPLTKRLILDAVLVVILIVEMLIQLTGIFLHEIIGAVLLATVIVHLVFERVWIVWAIRPRASSAKSSPMHIAKLVVAILLLIDVIVLGFSSVMISTVLFDTGVHFDNLYFGGIWYPIHSISSYVFCALVVVHLATHWGLLANFLHIPYDKKRRAAFSQGVGAVATLCVIALGVASYGSNNVQRWLEAAEKSASSASSSTSASSSGNSSSDSANSSTGNSSSNSASNSNSAAHSNTSSSPHGKNASNSSNASKKGDSTSDSTSGTSSSSDICPLCPKRCSLSEPQCEKPYNAGLISR